MINRDKYEKPPLEYIRMKGFDKEYFKWLNSTDIKLRKFCTECGFLEGDRELIILNNSMVSFIEYDHGTCVQCGHQKDGTTIPIVKKTIRQIATRLHNERKVLQKFITHYSNLTREQQQEVCIMLPRFMQPNYKAVSAEVDDVEEPYSWSVVYIEVLNDTKLARTMLKAINWKDIEDKK